MPEDLKMNSSQFQKMTSKFSTKSTLKFCLLFIFAKCIEIVLDYYIEIDYILFFGELIYERYILKSSEI